MNDQEESVEEPRGIEVRVIGGDPPAGWERIEEQEEVLRLVKSGVAGARSMEDVEPAVDLEASGGARRGSRSLGGWTLWMGLVVVVLVVGSVTWLVASREGEGHGPRQYEGVEMTYEAGEDPNDPFAARAAGYLNEGRAILERMVSADDPGAVASLLRDGSELGAVFQERWKAPDLDENRINRLSFELKEDDEGREWAVLSGRDSQLKRVRFVFVPEAGGLRFDWAASMGVNFPSLEEFRKADEGEESTFRVEVTTDHFYDGVFPENRFQCYKLTDVFADSVGWGYVARGSVVAEVLAQQLHLGGVIVHSDQMSRKTLLLRKPGMAESRQFELLDVVAGDWILWEED